MKSGRRYVALMALVALNGAKLMKFSKFFVMFGSIFVSTLVYALSFGWGFAVGLVTMIFVHEMGHVLFMVKSGMGVRWPFFIPMLGAVISVKPEEMKDPHVEAYIAYGGPLIGIAGGAIAYIVWALLPTHPPILLLASHLALVINLFNLIPVRPLDGGRITQIVSNWIKLLGITLIASLVWATNDPMLMIILLMTIDELGISVKQKAFAGLVILVLMISMIIINSGGWVVAIGFLFMGLALVGLTIMRSLHEHRKKDSETEKEIDTTAPAPVSLITRIKWLAAYLFLIVTALTILVGQAPYLPTPDK